MTKRITNLVFILLKM